MPDSKRKTKVTIGVLTYNHEKYIEECLGSVISQVGDFDLRIVIVNDKSKDSTDAVVRRFITKNDNIKIEYVINKTNLGAQKSIYKILGLIKETKPDYWSYIEGDDKYLVKDRTQKHIDLLQSNKSTIMSYNKLLLIDEGSRLISKHEPKYLNDILSTDQLAAQNHIGSFCATFYSFKCFDFFNPEEFEGLTVYDWFFNIWMSRFGEIRQIGEFLSGYRQHSASVWSSKSQADQYRELIWSIDSYNKKLNFAHDEAFQSYKRSLINQLSLVGDPMRVEVAIIGREFPFKDDSFVANEIKYILENNDSILVAGNNKKTEIASRYKQDHPDIASKVIGYDGDYSISAGCIYAVSINDAYSTLSSLAINNHDAPLVFEIGSSDEKKIKRSDIDVRKKLKSIFNSPYFIKVVVRKDEVKRYIIDTKLCSEEEVVLVPSSVSEKIFGKENMYEVNQIKSYYFQINNILRQCIDGRLQPRTPHMYKRLSVYYSKTKSTTFRKAKSLAKRNRVVFFFAKRIFKPLISFYRSNRVKY